MTSGVLFDLVASGERRDKQALFFKPLGTVRLFCGRAVCSAHGCWNDGRCKQPEIVALLVDLGLAVAAPRRYERYWTI